MPKLYNKENNILLEVNLVSNICLDIEESRNDSENWIPFNFALNVENEVYLFKTETNPSFSVFEIRNLIANFEQVIQAKQQKEKTKKYEFSSSESYFDIIVYDPFEDNELYIELWINMGSFTRGSSKGFDKGFRFPVMIESFDKFTMDIKKQLLSILDQI